MDGIELYGIVRNEFKNIQDILQAQILCQGHAPTAAGKNIPHDFRWAGLLVVAVLIIVSSWCPTHPDGIPLCSTKGSPICASPL